MNVAAFNRRQRAHNRRVIRLLKARLAELARRQHGNASLRFVLVMVAGIMGFSLLAAWAWPDVRAWLGARDSAVSCRIPEEHEQLHIVVVRRGRQLVTDCMYVVSRGQAQRAARGGERP